MALTYEAAVKAIRKANKFWQENYDFVDWNGGAHPAFWDKAAYHTGNMEVYKLLGDKDMLKYTIDWANHCNWMGNDSDADPKDWFWEYNQTQGSAAVIFGDWEICFQVYIDLYNAGIDGATIDRVMYVINHQIEKDVDNYWWWADALYMVMPVFTKIYKMTGDEKYLDALYKYFKYAKELMYDGKGGIPTDASGYTTTAKILEGASYSNPDDYKNLFFRDANFVYPLKPNPGHENEKNFWARGNGWVFAGLCKVLSDMPATYKHYDEFLTVYKEMAPAIKACQLKDSDGNGFWTQSMLQNYPVGNNHNDYGYETSGTAFFTYGFFWGINNGVLDKDEFIDTALAGFNYLNDMALHDTGKVGYVQYIGSNATEAMSYDTTQNFGVGAFLLAMCEAARYAKLC